MSQKERNAKYRQTHREKVRLAQKIYDNTHRIELREKQKQRYQTDKQKVFDHYGRICACCRESESQFLTIDHTNGKGNQHRRELGGGKMLYRWLVKNNFPEGFRTLCYNCNIGRKQEICPHENHFWYPSSIFQNTIRNLQEIREFKEYELLWT